VGVSRREFARIIGASEGAVRKAIKARRIDVLDDGTIDVDAGRLRWARTTDPARSKVRIAPKSTQDAARGGAQASVTTEDDARDAVSLVRRVLREEGADGDGTIDFDKARIAETILKSHERELKMAQRRKELVPLASVKGHVERAFIGLRQAIQRLPSRHVASIAAEIGCDPSLLDAALSKAIAAELDVLSSPVVRA
jgi:hypothetical protein